MKARTTTNLDVLVLVGSIIITEFMPVIAMAVRKTLSLGAPLLPGADAIPPMLYFIVCVIWMALLMLLSVPRYARSGLLLDGLWRLVTAVGFSSLTFAGALFLSFRATSRLFFIYFVVLDLLALLLFYGIMRMLAHRTSTQSPGRSRVIIAGAGRTGLRLARAISNQWNHGAVVVGFVDDNGAQPDEWPLLGTLAETPQIIETQDIDEIIIALPLEAHPRLVELVRQLQSTHIHIRLVPDLLDFAVMHASVDYLEGLPIVGLRVSALSDEARIAKRLFDIVVSGLLLLCLWPILLLIALLIRVDSPGPIFYIAERMGENGRIFRMFKFRTMVRDAEARWEEVAFRRPDGKLSFKLIGDPRVTRVGRWLRRTSLDELPQLFNVLRGDMSLVGPRPELPMIVREEYEPWQWSRFTVPQGMTGWWQVHRRGFEHQHLCTADDLYYIQNYSLMLDIRILLRTIFVVLTGQGAY